jgi:hypothetical protein
MIQQEPPYESDDPKPCPFPDCNRQLRTEHDSAMHYEREHAGRVRVLVTIEHEQLLGDRDPQDVADAMHDRYADDFEVAWTRAEVVEPADDHSQLSEDDAE